MWAQRAFCLNVGCFRFFLLGFRFFFDIVFFNFVASNVLGVLGLLLGTMAIGVLMLSMVRMLLVLKSGLDLTQAVVLIIELTVLFIPHYPFGAGTAPRSSLLPQPGPGRWR